jgi:hypothetical protein
MDLQFIANIEINQKELQIAIKVMKEEYPAIKLVGCFAKQKINNFNLVTGLRARKITKKNTLKWLN